MFDIHYSLFCLFFTYHTGVPAAVKQKATFFANSLGSCPAKPIIILNCGTAGKSPFGGLILQDFFEGEEAMDSPLAVILVILLNFVLLAVYYTLFGVRRELIATKELLKSELSDIRKLLAK
jgi:hypothetical protein